jgi:predicted phosphodiesterase
MGAEVVLLSDVHLSLRPKPALIEALGTLFERHPGATFSFVGDFLEFSAVDTVDPELGLCRLTEANRDLLQLLQRHVAGGGQVEWIAGNHDAPVAVLGQRVGVLWGLPVAVYPWFRFRNGVHIEHGHVYDRDNAPLHPARSWVASEEPLGTALMRRFVTRYEVPEFAHAHQTTPYAGLKRAVAELGTRVPGLVLAYLGTAGGLCLDAHRAGSSKHQEAWDKEERSAVAQGAAAGLPEARIAAYVEGLLAQRVVPTHAALGTTFMRLYLDQVSAALCCGLGLVSLATGAGLVGTTGLGVGGAYLWAKARRVGVSRYPGPERALREAGQRLMQQLGISHVVMGHSHVPEQKGGYLNLGSFGYPEVGRGRGYALLHENGHVEAQQL